MQKARNLLVITLIVINLTAFIPIAYATQAPPAPICQVEGQILDINKKVTLKLTNITTYQEVDFDWIQCDEKYKSSLEKNKVEYFESEKLPLEKGMVIKGLVHSGGDEFSGLITKLYDVQVLSRNYSSTNWFSVIILRIKQLFTHIQAIFR